MPETCGLRRCAAEDVGAALAELPMLSVAPNPRANVTAHALAEMIPRASIPRSIDRAASPLPGADRENEMTTRRNTLGLAAAMLGAPALVRAQGTIGLAERRAIAAYRQETYPAIEQGIQQAAGFPVPIEVEWDQLTLPGDAPYYARDDYFGKTIFEPLTAALRAITADAMGRDALRAKLQRIRIRYDEKTAPASNYPNGLSFAGGVLDINWRPYANTADLQERTQAITQLLEKNL
jgi:hypothetical protein